MMFKVSRTCGSGVLAMKPRHIYYTSRIAAAFRVWVWIDKGYNVDVKIIL